MAVPKVSIGLPVYNGGRYLRSALESILRQDYTESEMIILDNSFTYPMCIA
jgi:Glycosyltransferases involved in cell wall biogenesis